MLDLGTLNPQQRLAVETVHGPMLILAGAGTGKTRVITFRVANLVRHGVSPEHILAVTFTNKAAREMKERVGRLLGRASRQSGSEKCGAPTISTFHSLCVRILRRHITSLGYKRNFVIYSESDQLSAVKKILSHISVTGEKPDPAEVLAMLSRLKNAQNASRLFSDEKVAAMAANVQSRYQSALRASNAVDFDDLIVLTLQLFREYPTVLDECRSRYRYVMVDEYQDTNAAQFQLVDFLSQKHRNLCVVGDDDQSIYGWRGAEIANLLDLEKHYPEVKVIKLEQNYRSTNTILRAANTLIRNNARRRGKQLWSQKGQGSKIPLQVFPDDDAEARAVVENIEFARLARRVPWEAQAILYRTNIQSRALETALRQANVRYHLIGGQSYFDRREVKDLLAFFKFFLNPHDDVSLLRIANVPARGLSDATMERLLKMSSEAHCSVFSAMKRSATDRILPGRAQESISNFVEFAERTHGALKASASNSLCAWAQKFLEEIAYVEDLRRSERSPETAETRVRNLRELVASLEQEATGGSAIDRLEAFLEEISLDSDREDEKENKGDAVTLITMHSCKGLEFPHVHIVGLEEGLLPHSRSRVENTLDEERRLFYVALTRAQETLSLCYCLGRKKYGKVVPSHPSSFLAELPPDVVEEVNAKAKAPVPVDCGKNLFSVIRSSIG
jgi:superfamily I DNA/RNA helicase